MDKDTPTRDGPPGLDGGSNFYPSQYEEEEEEEEKEDIYHQLQTAFYKRKVRDLTMVIGYLNAKVGSDNRNQEATMGTHGEGDINENGEMFCDFCASN